MSIPDYCLCDVCGAPTKLPPLTLFKDRAMDAAGSMENIYETFDLCAEHSHAVLRWALERTGPMPTPQDGIGLLQRMQQSRRLEPAS